MFLKIAVPFKISNYLKKTCKKKNKSLFSNVAACRPTNLLKKNPLLVIYFQFLNYRNSYF